MNRYPQGMSAADMRRNYREAYIAYHEALGPDGRFHAKLRPLLDAVKYWQAAYQVHTENIKYFGNDR